jgi:hypothetical protein
MADGEPIWVCAVCHSVNKIGAKQCYKCRTPKDRAAFDPLTEDIGSRTVSLPDFEPSRPYAMVATVLILVIGVLHAINSLVGVTIILREVEGDLLSDEEIINFGVIGLATFGIALIALTGWAFWLSKAVRTMPALGLGYPAANGLMAFVENFIPVLNLWRVPAIVRDIVQRLEPGESRGGTLISAAWVGLIAGYLLPRFGGFVNSLGSETFEGYVRNLVIIQLLSLGLVLTGSIFLVVLIWWIEGRILRRQAVLSEAGPDGLPAPTAVPGRVAAGGEVAWAVGKPTTNFGPTAAAIAPATPAVPTVQTVAGPLGSVVVAGEPDQTFSRPISALTGTLTPSAATAVDPAAAVAPEPVPTPEPAAPEPSTGPRLELTIAHDGSMVATLDGESEPISIKELRDAAKVLARVRGSAVVSIADGTPEATSMAGQALRIFADAGVPAEMGQRPG